MDIFEYVDSRKDYYESLEDEHSLEVKKNEGMIKELSEQLELLLRKEEEADFEGRFSAGKKDEELERERIGVEKRIQILKEKNEKHRKVIEDCAAELHIINDLELPKIEIPAEPENSLKTKLLFCSKIALQDPNRCKLELEELLRTFCP